MQLKGLPVWFQMRPSLRGIWQEDSAAMWGIWHEMKPVRAGIMDKDVQLVTGRQVDFITSLYREVATWIHLELLLMQV